MVQHPPDLNDPHRWSSIKRKTNETRAAQAFELFRSHGIEPILIKGIAASLYYPSDHFRDAIDLDLAVQPSQFDKAKQLVASAAAATLAIDLHAGMRHLDPLDWEDLFENSRVVAMSHGPIRVLRPEDHLRVLCVHWLTDGGSDPGRLWDITYAVKNRPSDFDWHRFLNIVPTRRRWLECAVGVAKHAHGLDLADTPLECAVVPEWLLNAVESEWASPTPFRPLRDSLESLSSFGRQLGKRFPPNPITATILMNGSVDAPTRIHYQACTWMTRALPSLLDLSRALAVKIRSVRSR